MAFRIGRTLSPAAAPIYLKDIVSGITGLIRGGKTSNDFEKELKEYFQVRHCFAVSSGKTALTTILIALKEIYPDRNEVLIPAFTCYSVPSAIVRAGLKIRLCDLAPGSFDFDYEKLSTIISTNKDHLLCVVPVHLFGFTANIDRIRETVADDSIFIVEDAAQAMGGEYKGKKLGTVGDVGFFSLGRGKAISTVEGGVILTSRDDIARRLEKTVDAIPGYDASEILTLFLYSIALFVLSRPSLFWLPKALPLLRLGETIYNPHFKMRRISSYQAGLARDWESKLQKVKRIRLKNVQEMLVELEKIGLRPSWGKQNPIPGLIRFPLVIEDLDKREAMLKSGERIGLGIAGSYPDTIDSLRELCFDFANALFPVAKQYAEKLVTLPVHPYIQRKDREKITELLSQTKQL